MNPNGTHNWVSLSTNQHGNWVSIGSTKGKTHGGYRHHDNVSCESLHRLFTALQTYGWLIKPRPAGWIAYPKN